MEIVLVYSGKTLPQYLEENIKYLKNTFPDRKVILLLDNPNYPRNYEKFATCVVINEKSEQMLRLFENLNHSKEFWDGFWFKTIERFFLLESYMSRNPDKPLLHIESDVLLFPNFPFEQIERIAHGLAFPVISKTQAVASVFFVRDLMSLRDFLSFAFERSFDDSTATDMSLLANYALLSDDVFILPSIPKGYSLSSEDSILFHRSQLRNESELNCLFDGATYGQYLFGIDPRNNLGNRRIFLTFPNHFVNPSKLDFSLEERDSQLQLCVRGKFDSPTSICCLHIHSKDLRAFTSSENLSRDLLILRVAQSKQKMELSEFVPSLFFIEFPSFSRAMFHKLIALFNNLVRFK